MARGEDSGIAEGLTIARPIGPFNPEISAGFTVAPAVVYSPNRAGDGVHDKQIRARERNANAQPPETK